MSEKSADVTDQRSFDVTKLLLKVLHYQWILLFTTFLPRSLSTLHKWGRPQEQNHCLPHILQSIRQSDAYSCNRNFSRILFSFLLILNPFTGSPLLPLYIVVVYFKMNPYPRVLQTEKFTFQTLKLVLLFSSMTQHSSKIRNIE